MIIDIVTNSSQSGQKGYAVSMNHVKIHAYISFLKWLISKGKHYPHVFGESVRSVAHWRKTMSHFMLHISEYGLCGMCDLWRTCRNMFWSGIFNIAPHRSLFSRSIAHWWYLWFSKNHVPFVLCSLEILILGTSFSFFLFSIKVLFEISSMLLHGMLLVTCIKRTVLWRDRTWCL